MNINGFEVEDYNIYKIKEGATTSTCPKCSEHRKPENQKSKCMSVFWDTGLGQCNHCGERVQLHTYKSNNKVITYKRPSKINLNTPLSEDLLKAWESVRKISKDTLNKLKIIEAKKWMPKAGKEIRVVQFPYILHGEVVNIKSRGKNKDFMFEKECELIMYNLDAIIGEKECVVVEGEPDAASYIEAGIENVTSVPNGFTLPRKDGTSTINTSYLDNYYDVFASKEKIFLAVDNDEAGKHGQRELIRRFGSEKCWLVDFKDCKDANEYLVKYGKEELAETIKTAKQVPLEYIETFKDLEDDLIDFYLNGSPKGYTTGVESLDKYYSTETKQFTVITGAPTSGKSEICDTMALGYALRYGIKTAFASPENKPNKFHADKIIKKIIGYKPTKKEHIESKGFIRASNFYQEHFFHVEFDSYDLESTLKKFEELVKRKGVRFFVLDPYNKIRLKSSYNKNVNDYTSDYFMLIDAFCKRNDCFLALVMHPNKMEKVENTNTFKMPNAYNIKGGGEVYDMAYHILGFVKDIERRVVMGKTLKVKFQHLGLNDKIFWLGWNINNGRHTNITYDPEVDTGDIVWTNNDVLEEKEKEEKQKVIEKSNSQTTAKIMFEEKKDIFEPHKTEDECPF